jgi:hypothetical protein
MKRTFIPKNINLLELDQPVGYTLPIRSHLLPRWEIILLLFFCIFFIVKLSAQETEVRVISSANNKFRVGDMDYAKSFKGLKYFMDDTKADNPELYQKLLPAFSRIKDKHDAAVVTFASTAIIGATVAFVSLLNAAKVSTSDHYSTPKVQSNLSGYILGGGIVLGGVIVASIISPKEADIYQFINLHNRNSPNKKIDWGFGINLNPSETVKITCNF